METIQLTPEEQGFFRGVARSNVLGFLATQREGLERFKARAVELGASNAETVLVYLSVDSPLGGPLANLLMPGHNWDFIRQQGLDPVARGLAKRVGVEEYLLRAAPEVLMDLGLFSGDQLPVLCVTPTDAAVWGYDEMMLHLDSRSA